MPVSKPARKVFISYNTADREWAEWIATVVEEAGDQPIIQTCDFRPGKNFVLCMDKAVAEADLTIANGVGPNAVNLREKSRPCCLCGFPVLAAAGLLLCSWAGVPDGAFPSRGSFCDIPADLWGIGGLA